VRYGVSSTLTILTVTAAHGEPLYFGRAELWLGPVLTLTAGAALTGSLLLLLHNPTDNGRPDVFVKSWSAISRAIGRRTRNKACGAPVSTSDTLP
jgi:hypothetical protein